MKVQKRLDQSGEKKKTKPAGDPVRSFMLVTACTCAAVVLAAGGHVADRNGRNEVYAASGNENETFSYSLMIQDRKSSLQESRESYQG